MAIVSLSKAAKITGKSKSTLSKALEDEKLKGSKNAKGNYEISTDDLFALYPEKEQQKCEKLETELADCKAQLLSLENKLKDEVSKREALEHELENMRHTDSTNKNGEFVFKIGERIPKELLENKTLIRINNLVKFLIMELPEVTDYDKNVIDKINDILFMYGKIISSYGIQYEHFLRMKFCNGLNIWERKNPEDVFKYTIETETRYLYLVKNDTEYASDSKFVDMIRNEFGLLYELDVENYLKS